MYAAQVVDVGSRSYGLRVIVLTTTITVATGSRPGQVVSGVNMETPDLVVQGEIHVGVRKLGGDKRIQDGDGWLRFELDDDVGVW